MDTSELHLRTAFCLSVSVSLSLSVCLTPVFQKASWSASAATPSTMASSAHAAAAQPCPEVTTPRVETATSFEHLSKQGGCAIGDEFSCEAAIQSPGQHGAIDMARVDELTKLTGRDALGKVHDSGRLRLEYAEEKMESAAIANREKIEATKAFNASFKELSMPTETAGLEEKCVAINHALRCMDALIMPTFGTPSEDKLHLSVCLVVSHRMTVCAMFDTRTRS